ncbi:MAG: sigma-54 dependent transcriptional regulator [Gemmataceae bacterium]|nr:sigma-54 dependent transcriptional regulator [Gemmataceae bacterium]
MPTLLVIDDEESVRYSFRYVFEDQAVKVVTAATASEGRRAVDEHHPEVIVLDLQLPDRSGLDLLRELRELDPKRPIVFITAHGTTETAIEAMKHGAFDYLSKPLELERLTQILGRAFDAARLMHVPALLSPEEVGDRIVGRSEVMQEMCKAIGRIAPQDVTVLILGESGTGKELVARAIYHHSRRADKPFLAINCAAIPETMLESELFGHEQGAFTGATRRRIGKFEQCHQGTLLLDEIGDMAPSLQAKMLRVLQEQEFQRLGGTQTLKTDVRILAATNQNLEQRVAEGKFRGDLYYRLKGVTVTLPPLRERRSDIAELAHHFLFRFNRELGMDLRGIAPATLALLQEYAWPGNVRELQSVIREAMFKAVGHILLPEFLPAALQSKTPPRKPDAEANLAGWLQDLLQTHPAGLYQKAIETVERALLPLVLRHTEHHQTRAAELLGISRGTLRQKLKQFGLAVDKVLAEEPEEGTEPAVSVKT